MFGIHLTLKQFLKKKRRKHLRILPTDDYKHLSISRRFSKRFKNKFPNHKQKHNMSLNLWHEVNTKKLKHFYV